MHITHMRKKALLAALNDAIAVDAALAATVLIEKFKFLTDENTSTFVRTNWGFVYNLELF